jgi:geranylgeranylglycerol-phosphate geranylgeranyltransferase
MTAIVPMLKLLRPGNIALALPSIPLATYLLSGSFLYEHLWIHLFMALILMGFGNLDNDLCDLAADRINAPHRPLVSGVVGLKEARWVRTFLWMMGAFSVFNWSPSQFKLYTLISLALIFYNRFFKHWPLVGNICVALLCLLPFYLPWLTLRGHFPASPHWLLLMFFAFYSTLVREVLKDLEDLTGDELSGSLTLASFLQKKPYGRKILKLTPYSLWFGALLPPLLMPLGAVYALILYPLILWYFIKQLQTSHKNATFQQKSVKLLMFFGMIAIFADQWIHSFS